MYGENQENKGNHTLGGAKQRTARIWRHSGKAETGTNKGKMHHAIRQFPDILHGRAFLIFWRWYNEVHPETGKLTLSGAFDLVAKIGEKHAETNRTENGTIRI